MDRSHLQLAHSGFGFLVALSASSWWTMLLEVDFLLGAKCFAFDSTGDARREAQIASIASACTWMIGLLPMSCIWLFPGSYRQLSQLAAFLAIDLPSSIADSCGFGNDSFLSSLAQDLDEILSDTDDLEWSLETDANLLASLDTRSRSLPRIRRIYPGRFKSLLRSVGLLLGCCPSHTSAGIILEAVSDVPVYSHTIGQGVGFLPDILPWRERRQLQRWSQKAELQVPDPTVTLMTGSSGDSISSTCSTPALTPLPFYLNFNPATTGMRLLLAERMDRVLRRVEPKRK